MKRDLLSVSFTLPLSLHTFKKFSLSLSFSVLPSLIWWKKERIQEENYILLSIVICSRGKRWVGKWCVEEKDKDEEEDEGGERKWKEVKSFLHLKSFIVSLPLWFVISSFLTFFLLSIFSPLNSNSPLCLQFKLSSLPLILPSSILLLDICIDPLETFIDTCDDGNQSGIYWNKEQNDEFSSLFNFLHISFLLPQDPLFIGSVIKKERKERKRRRFTNTVSNLHYNQLDWYRKLSFRLNLITQK